MPPWWEGHPLRKEHPARATEMGIFQHAGAGSRTRWKSDALSCRRNGGCAAEMEGFDCLFLNIGPHHPGTHGVLAHHRADGRAGDLRSASAISASTIAARKKWANANPGIPTFPIPIAIDYLGGVLNNFPYVLAVEKLAGIEVPDRAKVIRIMLAELFRIISHLVFSAPSPRTWG